MGRLYTVTAKGVTVVNGIKIPVALATSTVAQNKWVALDITFEGTSATAKPLLVELVKTTTAPSGGSTYTPTRANQETRVASITTARINDTTDGGSPSIIKTWYVPYTSGVLQQLPLGREVGMNPSEFYEIRITQASGETAVNYCCNLDFEETGLYIVTAKGVSVVNGIKVAIQLATGAAVQNKWTSADITFEGTSATAKPLLVELVKTTGVSSSGGSAPTPARANQETRIPAVTTARINDAVDGSSPTILKSWYIPYTAGVLQQLPLGREWGMNPSEFLELRITQASGETAVNFGANVEFEE